MEVNCTIWGVYILWTFFFFLNLSSNLYYVPSPCGLFAVVSGCCHREYLLSYYQSKDKRIDRKDHCWILPLSQAVRRMCPAFIHRLPGWLYGVLYSVEELSVKSSENPLAIGQNPLIAMWLSQFLCHFLICCVVRLNMQLCFTILTWHRGLNY